MGEGFAEVGEGVAEFFLDIRALDKDFAGVPEGLKFGAEGVDDASSVMRVVFGGLIGAEFFVNCFVADTDGGALVLSRVCGEDGLDFDFLECGDDFVFGESSFDKVVDDGGPESFDGGGSVGCATSAAEFPSDAFFDDIEKLEANGEELGAITFGAFRDDFGEGVTFLPRYERAEVVV